jgi:hypothetical protein
MRWSFCIVAVGFSALLLSGCKGDSAKTPADPAPKNAQVESDQPSGDAHDPESPKEEKADPGADQVADQVSGAMAECLRKKGEAELKERMERCENAIKAAHEAGITQRLDQVLVRLGRLRLEFVETNAGNAEGIGEFADRRKDLKLDEESGDYTYDGRHFVFVVEKMKDSGFADDAAYELARLAAPPECQKDINCLVSEGLSPWLSFLKAYPKSDYALSVVERANQAVRIPMAKKLPGGAIKKPQKRRPGYDPVAFIKTLEEYEKAARELPQGARMSALTATENVRVWLGVSR